MHSRIQQLELELMTPNARSDELRLRELLHPQFIEVGRSGTLWTRESIIASLSANPRVDAPYVDEWVFVDIAERLVLVTYRTRDNSRHGYRVSRHSSLWETSESTPVLRFHQGTVVPDRRVAL